MIDWLERARSEASVAPQRPRVALRLADGERVHRIGSIEAAIAERVVEAGLPMRRDRDRDREDERECDRDGYTIVDAADASCAAIAGWLRREGVVAHWRDELLTVVDEHGVGVGRIERAAVRVLGLATEAVHLVGYDAAGATWVQQRAFDKSTDPGLWDTLMGGQVAAGESVETTLARETMEEAGLSLADLRELAPCAPIAMRRPVREGYLVERIAVFGAVVAEGIVPVNRDGEVERFECLADDVLIERLRAGAFTLEATLILGAEIERRAGSRASKER